MKQITILLSVIILFVLSGLNASAVENLWGFGEDGLIERIVPASYAGTPMIEGKLKQPLEIDIICVAGRETSIKIIGYGTIDFKNASSDEFKCVKLDRPIVVYPSDEIYCIGSEGGCKIRGNLK